MLKMSATLTWTLFIALSSAPLVSKAIQKIPDQGVYSLFPHEDLRTGRKLLDDQSRERYREAPAPLRYADSGRKERLPTEPVLVPILRPSFPVRSRLTNSYLLPYRSSSREYSSAERSRERSSIEREGRYGKRARGGRIFFEDEERRLYGYGRKYHRELPPFLDDRSRETNSIRPSPIDYSRGSSEESDRRYLPHQPRPSYSSAERLPPYSRGGSAERTRIHVFTTAQNAIGRYGSRESNKGFFPQDGPVRVDAPGPGAFLNHEEYLEFHTKLALDTLDKEKRKLEDAKKLLLFTPGPRPTLTPAPASTTSRNNNKNSNNIPGLFPPNFSKEVTVIEEELGTSTSGTTAVDDQSDSNRINSSSRPPKKDYKNNNSNPPLVTSTSGSPALTFNPAGKGIKGPSSQGTNHAGDNDELGVTQLIGSGGGGKSSQIPGSNLRGMETGFLPIVPFHLQGIDQVKPTVVELDRNKNNNNNIGGRKPSSLPSPLKPNNSNSFTRRMDNPADLVGGSSPPIMTTSPATTTSGTSPSFNLPRPASSLGAGVFEGNLKVDVEKTTVKSTTTTTTMARVGAADIQRIKFQREGQKLYGNKNGGKIPGSPTETVTVINSNGQDEKTLESPPVFVDSQEVSQFYTSGFNGSSRGGDDKKMVIHVQRIKSSGQRREWSRSSSTSGSSSGVVHTSFSNESASSGISTGSDNGIEEIIGVVSNHTKGPGGDGHIIAAGGPGINSGVVAKVHAHISRCPKLYGSVEIICDVNIRERHGNPNPQLTVGWVRKFYNESQPDVVLAVDKELAYAEDFHDKFNVTLAPGVSPMLRSVLLIREVTVPDCGNYECEVTDGVSSHRSETLVFLCH